MPSRKDCVVSQYSPKLKMCASLSSLACLIIVAKMPRLPHEQPTLTGQILWAICTGTALGWATRSGAELCINYFRSKEVFKDRSR